MNAIRSIAELQIHEVIYKGSMSRVEVASLRDEGFFTQQPATAARQKETREEDDDTIDNNNNKTAATSAAPRIALKTYDKATLTPRARCVKPLTSYPAPPLLNEFISHS